MVGVQNIEQCPQCGEMTAHTELQTRTMEETLFCQNCGYRTWTRAVIDRQLEKQYGKPYYKLREDGKRIFRHYKRLGTGAWEIMRRQGVGTGGVTPADEKQRKELLKRFIELSDEGVECKITMIKNGKVITLYETEGYRR